MDGYNNEPKSKKIELKNPQNLGQITKNYQIFNYNFLIKHTITWKF